MLSFSLVRVHQDCSVSCDRPYFHEFSSDYLGNASLSVLISCVSSNILMNRSLENIILCLIKTLTLEHFFEVEQEWSNMFQVEVGGGHQPFALKLEQRWAGIVKYYLILFMIQSIRFN